MRGIKWATVVVLVLFGSYSCHVYMNRDQRAAERLLAGADFEPAGPPIRVALSLGEGFQLSAPDPVRVFFPDSASEPRLFRPRTGTVRFRDGSVLWGAEEFRERIRLDSTGAPLQINNIPYPGVLELIPRKKLVISELSCEEYLLGVVSKEGCADFHPNALRALAVASRTYALYQKLFRKGREWHLRDTVASQVYGGHGTVPERVRRVVAETCGLVLTFKGKIFQAYYHSTCGGNTTRASKYFNEPDILPLSGTQCGFCRRSPFFSWAADFDERAVRKALLDQPAVRKELAARRSALGRITAVEPILEPGDIYPEYFRVVHKKGTFEIHAPLLRSCLNSLPPRGRFRSVATGPAVVSSNGQVLHFRGHGWGHGVGLCVFGAEGRARAGRDFVSILYAYYPGAVLCRAWSRKAAVPGPVALNGDRAERKW